jgi:hypothetical protein
MTEAEIRSIFQCLEVAFSIDYHVLNSMVSLQMTHEVSMAGQTQAKTALLTAIAALDSDSEAKVQALVVEWDAAELQVGEVVEGGLENGQGIRFSWDQKRKRIKDVMQRYLPFYRYGEVLAKQMQQESGSVTGMMWAAR